MADGVPTWEEVARDHGRFLYNVAYRLAGNDDDAQDLVQEALHPGPQGPRALRAGIPRRLVGSDRDERVPRRGATPEATPHRRAPRRPRARAPARARGRRGARPGCPTRSSGRSLRLPEDFRVPVVLCDVSDLSYEQIAEATGVPIGTVRSRIHRGRRMLRAALTADGVVGP